MRCPATSTSWLLWCPALAYLQATSSATMTRLQPPQITNETWGPEVTRPPQSPALRSHATFVGRLWVRGEGDVVELAEAEPLAIDGHAEVAQINGLPGGLGDFVGGGSRRLALRRQIGHDDSADARRTRPMQKGLVAFVPAAGEGPPKNNGPEQTGKGRG